MRWEDFCPPFFMYRLSAILFSIFSMSNPVWTQTVYDLLQSVEDKYATIESYSDEGQIKSQYKFVDQQFVEIKNYQIRHTKKGAFYFKFSDSYSADGQEYRIEFSKDRNQTQGKYDSYLLGEEEHLELEILNLITGLTGVSKRIIYLSSSLCLSQLWERESDFINELRRFDKIELLEDRTIKGEACHVLQLTLSKNWKEEEFEKQAEYIKDVTIRNDKQLQNLTKESDTIISFFVRKSDLIIIGQEKETFFDNGNYVLTRYFMNPTVSFKK